MGVKGNSANKNRSVPFAAAISAWAAAIVLFTIIPFNNSALASKPHPNNPNSIHLIIDPGHGGRDKGADGVTGTMEKAVNLEIAEQLTLYLESRQYKVGLTRSDDYDVPLRNRTAVANHAKANIFISIHIAASRQRSASGMIVYTYRPIEAPPTDQSTQQLENTSEPRAWNRIQVAHETKSRHLAETITKELGKNWAVKQTAAPLVVLEGADMPAVLVEIGHITHAETEKKLSDQAYLSTIAQALGQAIETYIANTYSQAAQ